MFFAQPMDWKREVVANLIGARGHGRSAALERYYDLGHSEAWDIRKRVEAALEARPSGRPCVSFVADPTGPCAGCQEKQAAIEVLRQEHAAERARGKKDLILQAAVLPGSTASIPLLVEAAFGSSPSRETVRGLIRQASERAVSVMGSFPWPEKVRRLASDELFAGKTPILNCVEPRSMAVLVLQRGPDRTAETWKEVFQRFPNLEVVASDQGNGILGALRALDILSQGDPFHANQELSRCLRKLERDAYRRIGEEYKAKHEWDRRKREGRPWKRAARYCRAARKHAAKAIERFDRATQAGRLLYQAVDPFDAEGRWLTLEASRDLILQGLSILQKVEAPYRKKVANAFDPDRILTYKAIIEAPSVFDEGLSMFDPEDLIDIAVDAARPRPTDPKAEMAWMLARLLDHRLAEAHPTWPEHRARIQDEVEHLFRSSSWSEAINSRIRVAQQVLKHLGGNFLSLLALVHNATPFRGGKRRGKTPFEILGIQVPPGDWKDWVRPA